MPRLIALLVGSLPLVLTVLAAAQEPASPAAGTLRVMVTKDDCQRLVKHVPAPDATYRPGVDVNGDPVVAADLGGAVRVGLPEAFVVPIEVKLFERFGIPPDPASYEADLIVGAVVVGLDGRAYFNGQPLQDEEAAEIAAKCQEILRRGG